MSESQSKTYRSRFGLGVIAALFTASAVVSSLTACVAATAPAKPAPVGVPGIRSIGLFASNNQAGASGAVAASAFDSALKLRLTVGGVYQITTFNAHLPSIDRAINVDNTLTASDIQGPITEPNVASKIARVMATDGFLIDEVDTYSDDPTTHVVSVTVSGSLYRTATGASARTFAVTGTATPGTADEGAAITLQRAVDSAATQVAITLGVTPAPTKQAVSVMGAQHTAHAGTALLVVLAAVMIAVIAHNAGSHANSGSNLSTTSGSGSGGGTTTGGGTGSGPPSPPGV